MRFRPTVHPGPAHALVCWYFRSVLGIYICGACVLQYWQLSDQLHHAEIEDLETVEGLLYFAPDGRLLLHEDYHSHPQSRLLLDRYMEVLSPGGQVLFRNDRLHGMDLGGAPAPREGEVGYESKRMRLADGTPVLAISHLHILQGKPLMIRLAYSTEPLRNACSNSLGCFCSLCRRPWSWRICGLSCCRQGAQSA